MRTPARAVGAVCYFRTARAQSAHAHVPNKPGPRPLAGGSIVPNEGNDADLGQTAGMGDRWYGGCKNPPASGHGAPATH